MAFFILPKFGGKLEAMNWLILLFGISVSFASPLEKMEENLKTYHGSQALECNSESSDHGLFADVSCSIVCKNSSQEKIERIKGVFSPQSEGVFPGNGSDNSHIIWASLGIAFKNWTTKVCLERAIELCKSVTEIQTFNMLEVESGAWKLNRFPGCHEKSVINSPFDESSKSNKVLNPILKFNSISKKNQTGFDHLVGQVMKDPKANCSHPIVGKVCFGDCVDLKAKEIRETIATPEPLGTDVVIVCGDQLKARLSKLALSPSVKREICESYYWNSIIKSDLMMRTCAALRGEVNCPDL